MEESYLLVDQSIRSDAWWVRRPGSRNFSLSMKAQRISSRHEPYGYSHNGEVFQKSKPICAALGSFQGETPHNRIVPSNEPDTTVLPSGEKATLRTQAVCPLKVEKSAPFATSQSFTV